MAINFPRSKYWIFCMAQVGWTTLLSIVTFQLVYFYMPSRDDAGVPLYAVRVDQSPYLRIFNVVSLVNLLGRVIDAVTDPLIAGWSDRTVHALGRRVSFMRYTAVPCACACFLLFTPPVQAESPWNVVWLASTQTVFFALITAYSVPLMALVPEMGRSETTRLELNVVASVGMAIGSLCAALSTVVGTVFAHNRTTQLQLGTMAMCAFSAVLMLVPTYLLDESCYCEPTNLPTSTFRALCVCLRNPNFVVYALSDVTVFVATAMITTGLPYFVTTLLELQETMVTPALVCMITVTAVFYVPVHVYSLRVGKKRPLVLCLLLASALLPLIYFLGEYPFSRVAQLFVVTCVVAVPIASITILPGAILTDIAARAKTDSDLSMEGIFFGARGSVSKLGTSLGVSIFSSMLNLGRDTDDPRGIRLSSLVATGFTLVGALCACGYREHSRELRA